MDVLCNCQQVQHPVPVGTVPCLSQITVCLIYYFQCDITIIVIESKIKIQFSFYLPYR